MSTEKTASGQTSGAKDVLSDAALVTLVERASNLQERLSGSVILKGGDEASAKRRLVRWKQLVEEANAGSWMAVLQAHGIARSSETDLLHLLGSAVIEAGTPLPGWSLLLREMVGHLANTSPASQASGRQSAGRERQIPFQQLIAPIADFAWKRVLEKVPHETFLSGRAQQDIQLYLLRRLASVAAIPLHTAFLAYRAVGRSHSIHLFFPEQSELPTAESKSHQHYDAFIKNYSQDGLKRFFMRYPVVARMVAELTASWIEANAEFLNRLHADRQSLAAGFNGNEPLGPVVAIDAGASDPHCSGRSVSIVTFGQGLRVVYKPRPIAIDRKFFALIQRINSVRFVPRLRSLSILDRGAYGWMEFARFAVCNSKAAARRYYRRAGALICLVYWLKGTDCHQENVVASGENPLLVDLEALAHPLRQDEISDLDNSPDPSWRVADSILRTGLLPLRHDILNRSLQYDYSGLNSPLKQKAPLPSIRWSNLNSDDMDWRQIRRVHRHCAHRPQLRGETLSIRHFEAEVVNGYRQVAGILQRDRTESFSRMKMEIFDSPRRFIRRPTLLYGLILQKSLHPAYLSEGIERSIELQAIPCNEGDEATRANEIADLERMDIPYSRVDAEAFLRAAPLETTDQSDLLSQIDLLKLSIRGQLSFSQGLIRPANGFRHHGTDSPGDKSVQPRRGQSGTGCRR